MANWKYYMKIKTGAKTFRYFYSKAEYDAYLNNRRPKVEEPQQKKSTLADLISGGRNALSSIGSKIQKTTQEVTKSVSNTVSSTINKTSNFMNSTLNSANKKFQSLVDTGKQTVQRTFKYFAKVGEGKNTRYFYTKEEYESFLANGKKTVQKLGSVTMDDILTTSANLVDTFLTGIPSKVAKNVFSNGKSVLSNLIDKVVDIHDSKKPAPYVMPSQPSNPTPTTQSKPLTQPNDTKPNNTSRPKVDPSNLPLSFPKQDYLMDHDDNMKSTNPNFKPQWDDPDYEFSTTKEYLEYEMYSNNCIACTVTFDLRERGYDVNARPYIDYDYEDSNAPPYGETILDKMYVGAEEVTVLDRKNDVAFYRQGTKTWAEPPCLPVSQRANALKLLETELKKQGNGARGALNLDWADENGYLRSGHSVAYTVENGVVYVRDTQHNRKWTMDEYINQKGKKIGNAAAIRLDPAEPTDYTHYWVRE